MKKTAQLKDVVRSLDAGASSEVTAAASSDITAGARSDVTAV